MTTYRGSLPLRALLVAEAEDFIENLREVGGDNRGPGVEWMLKGADLPPGEPWCAAFVNRVAEVACAKLNIRSPLEDVPLQGFVKSYVDYGEPRGWLRPETEPPGFGDLFVVFHPSKGRFAHIGFVADPHSVGDRFLTVEGNSNRDGGRNGFEVVQNQREAGPGIRFLNPWSEQ